MARVIAFSTVARSASANSVWIVSISEIGSILPGDVGHVLVLEAADDVGDGIGLANVSEKLIAESLALRRARDEPRDVDEFDDGRNHLLWLRDLRQLLEAQIRYFHHAHVGLDGAERVVLGGDAGLGERVEESGFADVGQTHDAALEAHEGSSGLGSEGGLGFVCSLSIAASRSPRAINGHTSRLLSIEASIASRSSCRGGCST